MASNKMVGLVLAKDEKKGIEPILLIKISIKLGIGKNAFSARWQYINWRYRNILVQKIMQEDL